MQQNELPKILYLSDVPVELSSAGATLMYRLFEHYPKDKLVVIQAKGVSDNEPRIPGIPYHVFTGKLDRIRLTRFAKHTKGLVLAAQLLATGRTEKIIRSFKPDIIVTVTIRLLWVNAYRLSKKYNIPLYVILHDDWLTTENHGKWQSKLNKVFANMYRHASERFCISPNMEKNYFSLFGVHGKILYPSRGKNDHIFPVVTNRNKQSLKFCYAGSLFTGDFKPMLDTLAGIIGKLHGELHVFSYWNKEMMAQYKNLNEPHVIFHSFMHAEALMRKMNEEMDVAVLLNSFLHEGPFRYNFTSKLVDYVSAGLPVLFWGPASSGSTDWALSLGYEPIVTTNDNERIAALVNDFHNDDKRAAWAKKIREMGINEFSYEKNYHTFIDGVLSTVIKQ